MNYFELFGLREGPSVNTGSIAGSYFTLQKKYHPDFYSHANESEKEEVLQQSAAINKAYIIFKDPDKTLEYFLQQKGILVADEKYELPPFFLMEMMEINESLLENSKGAVTAVEGYEEKLVKEVQPIIDGYSSETGEPDLLKLKEYYYKKKYLKRILDRLED